MSKKVLTKLIVNNKTGKDDVLYYEQGKITLSELKYYYTAKGLGKFQKSYWLTKVEDPSVLKGLYEVLPNVVLSNPKIYQNLTESEVEELLSKRYNGYFKTNWVMYGKGKKGKSKADMEGYLEFK